MRSDPGGTAFLLGGAMKLRKFFIASLVLTALLWMLALFTTEILSLTDNERPIGVALCTSPAESNRHYADAVQLGQYIYLIGGPGRSYTGRNVYHWIVKNGHLHGMALSVAVFALSIRRRRGVLIASLAVSLSLWALKLFTVKIVCAEDSTVGIAVRARAAMHNQESCQPKVDHIYLIDSDHSYSGGFYSWLVCYGYLYSAVLFVLLFAMWLRRCKQQATSSPQLPETVYRD